MDGFTGPNCDLIIERTCANQVRFHSSLLFDRIHLAAGLAAADTAPGFVELL